jgi:ribonuclease HI
LKLAEYNRVQLVWVLGDIGMDGNEVGDQLARAGSSHPLIGPGPTLGIPAKFARHNQGVKEQET